MDVLDVDFYKEDEEGEEIIVVAWSDYVVVLSLCREMDRTFKKCFELNRGEGFFFFFFN